MLFALALSPVFLSLALACFCNHVTTLRELFTLILGLLEKRLCGGSVCTVTILRFLVYCTAYRDNPDLVLRVGREGLNWG